LSLEPEHCVPLPEALAAIRAADLITIGPGSLYTSILPNLLVSGVADTIAESEATKIFVTNLMTQAGETDGYDAQRHLATVTEYAPQIRFDYVLVNDRPITVAQAALYAADGACQVKWDDAAPSINGSGYAEVVREDLLEDGDMVRHDPPRLAQVVIACGARARLQVPLGV
jgi:uncharacterized cofD-like protein